MTKAVEKISPEGILDRFDNILLDSYGVLINSQGVISGAAQFVEAMHRRKKQFLILTNDASKSLEQLTARYSRLGLSIPAERIISSGLLISEYYRTHNLSGAPTFVLGTDASREYVRNAGGEVVPFEFDTDVVAVVVCDDEGYPLLESLNKTVSAVFRMIDQGKTVHLLCANPDYIFPMGPGKYGVASGNIACILERALYARYNIPPTSIKFLGKPYQPIFDRAFKEIPNFERSRTVMIGDQLYTDVKGANDAGIRSVLTLTGVGFVPDQPLPDPSLLPTFVLPGW